MQPWEVLGLCCAVLLVYRAVGVLRRGVRGYRGYLVLLLGDLALIGWVVEQDRLVGPAGGPTVELLGGVIGCGLLVLVPALLDHLTREALRAEDFARAARVAGWKELLVPGTAPALEREFLQQLAAARAGRSEAVVGALRRQLLEAEPPLDEAIQERIVTVLLFAERWREAVTHHRTHLGGDPARYPALAVQLVRAHGALGDLEEAAAVVHHLEERLDPLEPATQVVLQQARLHLLAWAGERAAVERLLSGRGGARAAALVPPRTRESLLQLSRERASAAPGAADPALASYLEGVALRAESDQRELGQPVWLPPATLALVALDVLGFALFALLLGRADTLDNLVRGGANYHPAVRAGEWWRLWTALFVHGSLAHLFFNAYGLLIVGRLVEPVLGAPRLLLLYAAAGLAGNLASAYNPDPEVVLSLGGSGAVLGVMAALMVTLLLRRGSRAAWPRGWRREVLFNLAVLLLIQVAIGFWMAGVDHLAHLGGLLAGAAIAWLVAPGGLLGRGRLAQGVLAALLLSLLVTALGSAVALFGEQAAATMARLPRQPVRLGRATASALSGSQLRHAGGDEEALVVYALGLEVSVWTVPAPSLPEEALGQRMARDAAARAGTGASAGTTEAATAPPLAAWPARAAQLDARRDLVLYYARPIVPAAAAGEDTAGAATLVVRILDRAEISASPLVRLEVERLLGSLRADGEAPAAAHPAP